MLFRVCEFTWMRCSHFGRGSVPIYLITKNGAHKSASCTISASPLDYNAAKAVTFLLVCWIFQCAQICVQIFKHRKENIPDMFIGCQRVFLIVAADVLKKKKKPCGLIFLCIWVCKTEQWNIHTWPRSFGYIQVQWPVNTTFSLLYIKSIFLTKSIYRL